MGCSSLTSFIVDASNPQYSSLGATLFNKDKTEIVYVAGSPTNYKIPNFVTSIGNEAFSGCSSLTSVEIPNSVTSIGDEAFSGCSSLTSVEIPNSVTRIGVLAFYHCSSLTSVEIPNSVTSIGNEAFANCSSLTSVEIPNSVTRIGERAFDDCYRLDTLSFQSAAPPSFEIHSFLTDIIKLVSVPDESIEAYKATFSKKWGDDAINHIRFIGHTFYNYNNIYNKLKALNEPDFTTLVSTEYTAKDGLITDASQLSSNAAELSEGSLEGLIDNDRSTFFISTWTSPNKTNEYHFLQIDLGNAYKQIVLKYSQRETNIGEGAPKTLQVYATNTPNDENSWTDLDTMTCTYKYENGKTGFLPISLDKAYRYVRLKVVETLNNKKANGNLFFYWSELHAYYRPSQADLLSEAMRNTLTQTIAQAKEIVESGKCSSGDLKFLQATYDYVNSFIEYNHATNVDFIKSFYLTAYSDKPLTVPTGMSAAVVVSDGNGLRNDYRYQAGDIIPAYTGVLLKSGRGNAFLLPKAETTEASPAENLLHGTLNDETTYVEGAGKYYKLSYDKATGTEIGFYWGAENGGAFVNKGGKAFLALPAKLGVAQLASFSLFDLNSSTTTGINHPETESRNEALKVYDLNGRRVNVTTVDELPHGVYIVNSKKIMK